MKKLLAVVLALVMVLALAVPAIAADGLTVSTTKSGNDVTITVKEGSSTVAADVFTFVKNTTQTYTIGAYQVQVVYNGGGVKSAEIISAPVADDSNDTITTANSEQTIYLKGSGSDFTANWRNMFYLGGAEEAEDPSVWHIVFTGKDMSLITAMQLDFGENGIWEWTPTMGFSVNGGGNNPGWVVVAPAGWELDYVNSGKNNESGCYVVTGESGNINFNISGYHEGTPDDVPFYTYIYINKFIAAGDSHLAGEGFEFDVFPVDGPFVTPIGTMISDADGLAELNFDPGLAEGTYIVRERVPDGYAPVNDLVFTVDADGVATFEDGVNYIINVSLGKLKVTKDVLGYRSEEFKNASVTNDGVKTGQPWFECAAMTKGTDIISGVLMSSNNGNGNKVYYGTYSAIFNDDDSLTVTINLWPGLSIKDLHIGVEDRSGAFGAPGQYDYNVNGTTYTIPAAEIVKLSDNFYLGIHLTTNGGTAWLATDAYDEVEFEFALYDGTDLIDTFTLAKGEEFEIDLVAGNYSLVEIASSPFDGQEFDVVITAGGETVINVVNNNLPENLR